MGIKGDVRNIVASAARTATGNSGALFIGHPNSEALSVAVNVTAHAGTTPTLDITVEWSTDGGTTFYPADTADAISQFANVNGAKIKSFATKAPCYRVVWTIGGSAGQSFTFTVDEYAR